MLNLLNSDNVAAVANNGDCIAGFIAVWISHFILLLFVFAKIKTSTKRAKSKIKEEYAYFQHGLIYRSFLLGLNGKISKSLIVMSFILNIGLLLLIPLLVLHIVIHNTVTSSIFIVSAYHLFLLQHIRAGILVLSNFKL